MFGMLILVFVLFFGMPSMGISQGASIFTRPSKVFDTDVTLNEARSYAQRFLRSRGDKDALNNMKMRFRQVQDVVMLDEIAKRTMGWETLRDEEEQYMVSKSNFDHVFFGIADITQTDLHKAFLDHLEKAGEKLEQMSSRDLTSRFMDFSRKARGFSTKNMNDWLDSWGLDGQEYLNIKAREMRVRSYLEFLQSQVKTSQALIADQIAQQNLKWTFEYALFGADHVTVTDQVSDEEAATYIKSHEGPIKSYYTRKIKDYSKSKFAFTRISVNYKSVAEAAQAQEKIKKAHQTLKEGKEPAQVAKQLSKSGLKVQVIAQGNKSRANMSSELFDMVMGMELNQLSEVQGLDKTPKADSKTQYGSYYLIKLTKKEIGEEKKLEDVKSEIAKTLIREDQKAEQAKLVAEEVRNQVKSGIALSAALDTYNAQFSEQKDAKLVKLAESGEITLAGLVSGRLGNVGQHAVASDKLLSEIIHINDQNRVPGMFKVGKQWAVFVMKERKEPGLLERATLTEQGTTTAIQQARAEFFGRSWMSFIVTGDQNSALLSVLPIQILIKIQQEMFTADSEGFIDQILDSSDYRQHVKEDPIVLRYLSGLGL